MLLIQLQHLSHWFIIKGADGYCSQTEGGGLKVDILSGVSYLHVDIPFPSVTIGEGGTLI